MQSIISRHVDPLETAVLSVGTLSSGRAKNILADKARFTGTVRFFKKEIEEEIKKQLDIIVNRSAEAYGCEGQMHFTSEQPPVINSSEMIELVRPWLIKDLGEENVMEVPPCMASEDFSYYLQKVKGLFLWIGTTAKNSTSNPLHNPSFFVDPAAIYTGIAAVYRIAYIIGSKSAN